MRFDSPLTTLVVSTGGTGGHIFPAVATAKRFLVRNPAGRVLFIGKAGGPEEKTAVDAGLEFLGLDVAGVMGRGVRALGAGVKLARAVFAARTALGRFRPDVVLGFGGYASFPALAAAAIKRVPLALHEQNSVLGAANRFIARFAERLFLSFPNTRRLSGAGKVETVGCPVRGEIFTARDVKRGEGPPRLLVLGGSQGARALNYGVLEALDGFMRAGIEIRHQTGRFDFEAIRHGYGAQGAGERFRVEAFIEDMAEAYGWADLVLCRSGASTVFELAAAAKPAILVPFPHAVHDHQRTNAQALAERGAALLFDQNDLGGGALERTTLELLADPAKRAVMAEAAGRFAAPDAADRIVDGLERLVADRKQ